MTTPIFPSTLPGVIVTDYAYAPGNNLIRTEMENGPAKVRRRFISVPTEVNASWKFSREELATFERFYREELFDGAGWFKIKLINGAGETECTARFKQPYEASTEAREHSWIIKGKLEAFGLPVVPAA